MKSGVKIQPSIINLPTNETSLYLQIDVPFSCTSDTTKLSINFCVEAIQRNATIGIMITKRMHVAIVVCLGLGLATQSLVRVKKW